MKQKSLILTIAMLVMMFCCVAVVSATDIEVTDDVSDEISVDEVTDVVEDVETDDVEEDVVGDENQEDGTINSQTWDTYVYNTTGYLKTNDNLKFDGNFYAKDFGNFKIDKSISIDATNATFYNIGFDLIGSQVTINGGTFIFDEPTNIHVGLNITGSEGIIQNTIINVSAPANSDFYAIDVESSSNSKILNNIITYNCSYANNESFNYVIKSKNSADLNISENTINAYLPLKTVNWTVSGSIDADYVAGLAIEQCNNAIIMKNTIVVKGMLRSGSYPTLDAIIIANCNDAHIEKNTIYECDLVTVNNQYSYLYAIDVYSCNNIHIAYNVVNMNGNKSDDHIEGNGTGAAYCIQLSGYHQGVNIYFNNLTTINEGSNLGIYSQNYAEQQTHLTIYSNHINVTGKAGSESWELVSGIETQDYHAEIYNNTILVNNTAGYVSGNNAFGISYSQWINGTHYYYINKNTVEVINGDYAVYLINETSVVTGSVLLNTVTASGNSTLHGNTVIYAPSVFVGVNF